MKSYAKNRKGQETAAWIGEGKMPIRVLHVLNNLGSGGAESFVMNVYRNIDRTKIQFDFLIRSKNNGPMVNEIEEMGGKVFIQPSFPKHFISNYVALDKFLKQNAQSYVAIHVHANSLVYVRPLKLAKKYGIEKRIIHSHNTKSAADIIHKFNIDRIDRWATDRFACSNWAGEFMFPHKQFLFVSNGIDISKFSYSNEARNRIRAQFAITDETIVVGNVGRFSPQKNHPKIVEIFKAYHETNRKSKLLLVGEGGNRKMIEELVAQNGLQNDVIFTGAVTNVEDYLSAMDVFLLPSLWEGLAIVLIEAQANGLGCIASTTTPPESDCGNVLYLGLDESAEKWAEAISTQERKPPCSELLSNFDIKTVAQRLETFYLSEIEET